MSRRVCGERDVGAAAAAQPPVALPLSSHSLPTPGIKGTAPPPPPHYETATIRRGSCGHRGIIAAHNNYPQRLQIRTEEGETCRARDRCGGRRACSSSCAGTRRLCAGGRPRSPAQRRTPPTLASGKWHEQQLITQCCMNPAFWPPPQESFM